MNTKKTQAASLLYQEDKQKINERKKTIIPKWHNHRNSPREGISVTCRLSERMNLIDQKRTPLRSIHTLEGVLKTDNLYGPLIRFMSTLIHMFVSMLVDILLKGMSPKWCMLELTKKNLSFQLHRLLDRKPTGFKLVKYASYVTEKYIGTLVVFLRTQLTCHSSCMSCWQSPPQCQQLTANIISRLNPSTSPLNSLLVIRKLVSWPSYLVYGNP